MKSIKVLNRKFVTKGGKEFYSATIKGKYLPFATANVEENYTVRLTKKSKEILPLNREGIFELAYQDKGLWIDDREINSGKFIVRINCERVVFVDKLKEFPKTAK